MHKGSVVEYLEKGKFLCAVVLAEDAGKRLRLLNQNGREVLLPESRVVYSDDRPAPAQRSLTETQAFLKELSERRTRLAQDLELEPAWEVVVADGDGDSYPPRFLAELIFGGATDDDQVAAFVRAVLDNPLFFRFRDGRIVAHPPEVVAQKRGQLERERARAALIENGGRWLKDLAGGGRADSGQWPERTATLALIQDFYLFGNDAPESELARGLLKEAGLVRPHDPFHLLVHAGVWGRDEDIALLRQQVPREFSPEVAAQAAACGKEPLTAEGRRDLRHLPLFTIDAASTRDIDDALHVDTDGSHLQVGIHIADVARFIRPGDTLFQEAMRRGTSIYLPDRLLPMLPESLGHDTCSLVADTDRHALSFLVTLSPDGAVADYDIVRSLVRVKRRLSYDEADGMLDGDAALAALHALVKKLRDRRLAAGALLLPFPDLSIRVSPEGAIDIRLLDSATASRVLVAELMILANSLAARYLADRGIPGLFRSQGPPPRRIVQGHDSDLFANCLQRRFLARGELSLNAKRHAGLGVDCYTTVSSPIRRLLDLVMQQQIAHALDGRGPLHDASFLKSVAAAILSTQARAHSVRQLRERYWILRFLEAREGTKIEAMVIDRRPRQINVLLTDFLLGVEMPAAGAPSVEAGNRVFLRLARVEPLDNVLRLEW